MPPRDASDAIWYWLWKPAISPAARTLLYRRLAYLEAGQKKLDEALKRANQAKAASDGPNNLGAAYTYAAIHNLLYAISQNASPESLGDVRFYLRQARKLIPAHRRSLPRYQLYWIEGLILIKLGSGRRSERLLHRAQAGFREVDACFEMALIALDISELYRDEGRRAELEELAGETFRQFKVLSADAEAVAALKLWKEAVDGQELEDTLLSEVGEKLSARMRGHREHAAPRRRRKNR